MLNPPGWTLRYSGRAETQGEKNTATFVMSRFLFWGADWRLHGQGGAKTQTQCRVSPDSGYRQGQAGRRRARGVVV